MVSDRNYIEDQLLDFIESVDPEKVYVYEIAADLGGTLPISSYASWL